MLEREVEGLISAGRHERTAERATCRNGYRDRTLDMRLGSLQLRIPARYDKLTANFISAIAITAIMTWWAK